MLKALPMIDAKKDAVIDFIYSCQRPHFGFTASPVLAAGAGEFAPTHLASTYSAICALKTLGDDLSRVNKQGVMELLESCIVKVNLGPTTLPDGTIVPFDPQKTSIEGDEFNRMYYLSILEQQEQQEAHHTTCSQDAICQQLGVFYPSTLRDEYDVRFTFCVMALCELLDLWEEFADKFDFSRLFQYLTSCQTYEGGFGLNDCGQEAHGGATHTALMSYYLALKCFVAMQQKKLVQMQNETDSTKRIALQHQLQKDVNIVQFDVPRIVKFLLFRQGDNGWSGRTNKAQDSCYSYWLGSLLPLFSIDHLSAPTSNAAFLHECQSMTNGGFAKEPEAVAEILHTFYGLAGLSLMGQCVSYPTHTAIVPENMQFSLNRIDSILGITLRAGGELQRPSFQELFAQLETLGSTVNKK